MQPLTHPTICVDLCNPWENCIPTEPTERTEASCREKSPTERTEPTEASCREGSPTDSTDLHRCRRVWHPAVPTQPLTHPIICENQCNLWENYIPTEPTECTEASCREKSPTDCTDLHRCRRVWHPAVPTQPLTQRTICVDQCNPWENCIPTERRIHSIPNTHHL